MPPKTLYRLKDEGYPSFQWIVRGREKIGRVLKNGEDSFTGIIGRVRANGTSWNAAMNQVVAEVEGLDVSELNPELIAVKPVQERSNAILHWLRNQAAANAGQLTFTNNDLAQAAGWSKPNQALGNLVSRLDLCCFKAGLPSIGCAAKATFAGAWEGERHLDDWGFNFPVERMQRRAKTHRWTDEDFDRIQRESLALLTGSAASAWKEALAKHAAKIKEWAHQGA
jgi:hypothetical protein